MSYRGTKARPPMRSGDEYDALTRWRRWLVALQRAGVRRKTKRAYNKRARRQAKTETRGAE